MMKLLFTLKHCDHPVHEVLHQLVLRGLGSQTDIKPLADQLLAETNTLIKAGLLKNECLTITIHKVRSIEFNTLMIRYLDRPYRYQVEIKKEKKQTTLFA